ncbi:MAG: response regulator [Ruminococcus sp.]|nr:response regulator [Ruminococcus sp.]
MSNNENKSITPLRKYIAIGYAVIALLIGGIVFIYLHEWRELERIEAESKEMNMLRQKVHDAYAHMLDLTLYGEKVLEWNAEDTLVYRGKRLAMDSILCEFKQYYRPERLDSLCRLLSDKELQLFNIWNLYTRQEALNERIATEVPIIAHKSTQDPPKKRGGFLGLFKKKEKPQTTTSTMLYTLNRDLVRQQQEQSRELSEFADSLAKQNTLLNLRLQEIIQKLDTRVKEDLQARESAISTTRKQGYTLICVATAIMILLLAGLYVIIHRDTLKIKRYKEESANLIRKQKLMLEENEELLNARQKMMHTITHELRIPLSSIIGYAGLLEEETDEKVQQEYMGNIKQAAERMTSQLNSLLSFFRLDCGKEEVNLAPFRLTDIAETLEAEFRTQIEAKDVGFVVHNCEDYVVIGDKERIIQIGDNLLSNALKFTDSGVITLDATYKNGIYNLIVTDSGTGMPKGELRRVFKSFERLSNAATQDGFGLGLSIVDNLVRLLGGKIRINSDVGIGTDVSVDIPVTRTDERLLNKSQNETIYPKRNYSVVAIDNNVITLNMIKAMFAKCDVACDTCVNAGELIELIRHKRYDLLITDLRMPGHNGYDILELLRTSNVNNSKTIPVIVATASGSCTREELLKKGFSDCIFKPFSKQDLLDIADKNIADKEANNDEPDFTAILAYGDEVEMLDKVISVTEQDMQNFKNAAERKDLNELDELIHHLRSSWVILDMDKPLWELHELLKATTSYGEEKLQDAMNAVLEAGETIIRCASEKKKEVANG